MHNAARQLLCHAMAAVQRLQVKQCMLSWQACCSSMLNY
jgi:hypothetical protein